VSTDHSSVPLTSATWGSMNGHQLAHAGILWVLAVNNPTRPGGGYEGDVARSSTAPCALGPVNNVCQWQ
jgi:hypothetical protein